MYYIDLFSYIEVLLHSWNKSSLVIVDNLFRKLLDLVCNVLIRYIGLYFYLIFLFSFGIKVIL